MSQKIKVICDDATINIVLDTLEKQKQALVFANTKRSAEKAAEDIAKKIKETSEELQELSNKALKVLSSPTKQCERLAFCLKKGIAFHHAGLTYQQRELIEDNFRNGIIKVIASTPTLAYGLDLPAYRVVLKDLRRFGPRGLQFIPVLEYLQMAGRAGRPKYDDHGEAIAICTSEAQKDEITTRYVHGEPEEIESKLAVEPVLRMYLLSLIAMNFVNKREDILKFFEKTFWAFQFQDMDRLESIIEKILQMLIDWGFLIKQENNSDFQSANEIEDSKYNATQTGKRVAELYIDPLTAHEIVKALEKTKNTAVTEFSFLHLVSSALEMRPYLRVRVKEYEDIQEALLKYQVYILKPEPSIYDPDYDDYLSGIKSALMLNEWIDEKDEGYLLEKYTVRPGELRVKMERANWLLYCTEELARILKMQSLLKDIRKTKMRLKHGAREELLTLLKLKNIGRVRARKMFNNSIKNIADVKKIDIVTLSSLLGKATANNLKKQVGEEVPEPINRKRKGQTGLGKFK